MYLMLIPVFWMLEMVRAEISLLKMKKRYRFNKNIAFPLN
jgi:hypothetical protein